VQACTAGAATARIPAAPDHFSIVRREHDEPTGSLIAPDPGGSASAGPAPTRFAPQVNMR
jgi:hypothetical protein